ncbi:MAG: SMP-30/gluconolactonase/LRE family protein [Candidatus Zhuqueibacterota bacterium]
MICAGKMLLYLGIFISPFFFLSCRHHLIDNANWELVATGFSFPEGPAWDGQGLLYVSNCNSDWIARIENGEVDRFLSASERTFGKTNGMIVSKTGDLYACDFGRGAILKISWSGEVRVVTSGFQGARFNRPNDINFDRSGNLYFTDPKSYQAAQPDGRVFYHDIAADTTRLVAVNMDFPNGLAMSPREAKLFVCESGKSRIVRFDVVESGRLANMQVFVELPGGDPDGLEFDTEGNLWVAHFGSGTVFVIAPDGHILHRIKTPGKKPSNLEFGDADGRTLFLTEDETNSIYKLRVCVTGYRAF